jgi:hypothetical protein
MARTPTYCAAADVSSYLQRSGFGAATTPALATINDLIVQAERKIERQTGRAWTTLGNVSAYSNATPPLDGYDSNQYESHDLGPQWFYYNYGLIHKPRIQLRHPDIVVDANGGLSLAAGDSIQVSFGGAHQEMLSTWTAGYMSGNYYVDAESGNIYINNQYPLI